MGQDAAPMPTVLITGASSGIGAATALRLDADGMHVFAGLEHDEDGATALAGASERLTRLALDVTDAQSIRRAIVKIQAQAPAGLDALINNAGVGFPGPLEILPLDALRRQLDVNVVGQVAVSQAALPLLRLGGGRLVFVGSVGGLLASQFAGAYHASKFAIEAITDVWRQELEPEDIAVILIEPSAISTPIWEKAVQRLAELEAADAPELPRYRQRLQGFRETLHNADEHGKSPEDVADVIAQALTEKHPNTRYVVGGAGKLATALKPLVPDRLADKLAEQTGKN
jgi:NAD(P)-dependent dehydrogenase (short-subunit alcohol dehydrogenase family)